MSGDVVISCLVGNAITFPVRKYLESVLERANARGEVLRAPGDVSELVDSVAQSHAVALMVYRDGEVIGVAVVAGRDIKDARPGVLEVVALVGQDIDAWLPDLADEILALAEETGAKAIGVRGRPAWRKRLAEYGFKCESVYMARALE